MSIDSDKLVKFEKHWIGYALLGVCLAMLVSHSKVFQLFPGSALLFFLGFFIPFFFWRKAVLHPLLWLGLAGYFSYGVWQRPAIAANHEYLAFYLSFGVLLCSFFVAYREQMLGAMARWLFVALMSVAALQKFFSPAFYDGSFLALMIAEGDFLQILWKGGLLPKLAEVFTVNREVMANFESATAPIRGGRDFFLQNPLPGSLGIWAKALAWVTIVAEVLLALAFAFFPRSKWTHLSLLLFGASLILLRPEVMFAALFLCMAWVVWMVYSRAEEKAGNPISLGYAGLIVAALLMQFYYSGATS